MATLEQNWVGHTLLGDRYEVLRELGRGGMAIVYRARDQRLGCDVVIKVPQAALLLDPAFTTRFAGEVQSLVRLSHPHIVRVLDAGQHDGLPFAVLQYLAGGSLRSRRSHDAGGNPISPLQGLQDWLLPVAEALDYMHRQNYVHRDVKPDNILFDTEGQVYLSDFGVAKALIGGIRPGAATFTGAGAPPGTPQYMAPELIIGQPYDGRADQFALAVTVFELISGQMPFVGSTPTAIYEQQKQLPIRLDILVPQVPPDLASAVQRALSKAQERRFESCVSFVRAVGNFTGGAAVRTPVHHPAFQLTLVQTVKVSCPTCHQAVSIPATMHGKTMACPKCKSPFGVPALAHPRPVQNQSGLMPAPGETSESLKPTVICISPAGKKEITRQKSVETPQDKRHWTRHWKWLVPSSSVAIIAAAMSVVRTVGRIDQQPQQRVLLNKAMEGQLWRANAAKLAQGGELETCRNWTNDSQRFCHFDVDGMKILVTHDTNCYVRDPMGSEIVAGPMKHASVWFHPQFSPDGSKVITASSDFAAMIWDARTGLLIAGPLRHFQVIYHAAFSCDGRSIVTASADKTANVWDAESGKLLATLHHEDAVRDAEFSPDGRTIVTANLAKSAHVWDAQTGRLLIGPLVHNESLRQALFSPNGSNIFTASWDKTVKIWDAHNGNLLGQPLQHDAWISHVAISRDSRKVVTITGSSTARVWDAQASQLLTSWIDHNGLWYAAFSPDGRAIVTSNQDNKAQIRDSQSGKLLAGPFQHTHPVWLAAFSPDGSRVVTVGSDYQTAEVWEVETGRLLASTVAPK